MARTMSRAKRRLTSFTACLLLASLLGGCGSSKAEQEPSTHTEVERVQEESDKWLALTEEAQKHLADRDLTGAERVCLEALALARGDLDREVTSVHNLGKIRLAQGRAREGISLFKEAIRNGREQEAPDYRQLAACWNKLGAAEYTQGDFQAAMHALREAEEILHLHHPGDRLKRKEVLENLLLVSLASGGEGVPQVRERIRLINVELELPMEPGSWGAVWLARVLSLSGSRPAERLCQRALKLDPSLAESRFLGRRPPHSKLVLQPDGTH